MGVLNTPVFNEFIRDLRLEPFNLTASKMACDYLQDQGVETYQDLLKPMAGTWPHGDIGLIPIIMTWLDTIGEIEKATLVRKHLVKLSPENLTKTIMEKTGGCFTGLDRQSGYEVSKLVTNSITKPIYAPSSVLIEVCKEIRKVKRCILNNLFNQANLVGPEKPLEGELHLNMGYLSRFGDLNTWNWLDLVTDPKQGQVLINHTCDPSELGYGPIPEPSQVVLDNYEWSQRWEPTKTLPGIVVLKSIYVGGCSNCQEVFWTEGPTSFHESESSIGID